MQNAIKNAFRETLDYSLAPGAAEAKIADWLVVLGHGVTGDKDRPILVDTARALNAAGFDTLRFSFAGNGASGGDFRKATISKEADDLASILDAVAPAYPHIAYVGHSMGAAVGVLHASRDARIHALVSLAGMVDTKAFAEAEFAGVTPDQGCMWDDPECPLSSEFMEDLCLRVVTVAPLAASIRVPWLLVHGTADDVVLPKDSEQIKALSGDAVTLRNITGAGHSFEGEPHRAAMTRIALGWLGDVVNRVSAHSSNRPG